MARHSSDVRRLILENTLPKLSGRILGNFCFELLLMSHLVTKLMSFSKPVAVAMPSALRIRMPSSQVRISIQVYYAETFR